MAIVTSLDAPLSAEPTHVFLLPLSVAGEEAGLPPTDIERAETEALAPSRRAAFLARRRLLRRATALRLGRAPGDVVIARDANGAPRITSAREPIFVSLASRGGLVAIALSDRPVGVDVEIAAANPPEPAWNILHSREREWLSKQSGDEQAENFLALWCVKEAYLKAIGLGLRREPAEIAVTLLDRRQVSIEDAGRSVGLDAACVTRREAHGAPAVLAWVVLAR
ncbi:MAG: 4-phosphopantetheinyl transferase [Methylobacteriaceae bacterium]|nr:4-phosphopantetheinyl transferase [Methylobacteriaceae bacterium]